MKYFSQKEAEAITDAIVRHCALGEGQRKSVMEIVTSPQVDRAWSRIQAEHVIALLVSNRYPGISARILLRR